MINTNPRIITRTIPATPRSKNYPQGYAASKLISRTVKTTSSDLDKQTSAAFLLQFIASYQINVVENMSSALLQFINEKQNNVVSNISSSLLQFFTNYQNSIVNNMNNALEEFVNGKINEINLAEMIKKDRKNIIAALVDENSNLNVIGNIKATGEIMSNQTIE